MFKSVFYTKDFSEINAETDIARTHAKMADEKRKSLSNTNLVLSPEIG